MDNWKNRGFWERLRESVVFFRYGPRLHPNHSYLEQFSDRLLVGEVHDMEQERDGWKMDFENMSDQLNRDNEQLSKLLDEEIARNESLSGYVRMLNAAYDTAMTFEEWQESERLLLIINETKWEDEGGAL